MLESNGRLSIQWHQRKDPPFHPLGNLCGNVNGSLTILWCLLVDTIIPSSLHPTVLSDELHQLPPQWQQWSGHF